MTTLTQKLLGEFLGTFYLVLTIVVSGNPAAIGGVLVVAVFSLGRISGAAFNPAVTIACRLAGAMDNKTAVTYIAIQCWAAFLAASLGAFIIDAAPGAPMPADESTGGVFRAVFAELLYTTLLALVVLSVAVSKHGANSYFGLAIGGTVFVGATSVGKISGAAFNPAVAMGLQIARCTWSGDSTPDACHALAYLPMYWATGMVGGAAAAALFKIMGDPAPGAADEAADAAAPTEADDLLKYNSTAERTV
jgi:aquaporin Z